MLSPLQQRIRHIVASLPASKDVALAGGAALILHGVVDRTTSDLDFFGTRPDQVDQLLPTLERALTEEGLTVERVKVETGFARLVVTSGAEQTVIDLAWDARRLPPIDTSGGLLLAEDELAADKTLALFGRAAARDFIDVAALTTRYSLDELCRLASEKDPGFDQSVLADMLSHIDRLPQSDFALGADEYQRLREQVSEWRRHLLGVDREHSELGPSRRTRQDPPELSL